MYDITDSQAYYLIYLEGYNVGQKGSPRGLYKRGLIRYTWGKTPRFGYTITEMGKKAFEIWLNKPENERIKDVLLDQDSM